MAGSSFVRMSDALVLPLQLLIFFFCVEVFNWKAGPTHCDGRQWAPLALPVGLPLPDSELPAFWTLHLDDINWTQPTVGLGDKGGLSWDSNPDPGGGRHGRRRGRSGTCAVDPTSSTRYTGRMMYNVDIDTNILIVNHTVSGVCTLAAQWECMQIVCRRSQVWNPFASFLNPYQKRYELVWTGIYWYVLVCTSMYQYEQVHAGMYWYVLVCTDIYLPVTVCTGMYQYTQSPVCLRLHWGSMY